MKYWLMILILIPALVLAGCTSPAANATTESQAADTASASPTSEPTLPPTATPEPTVEPTPEPSPTSPPPVQWMAYIGRDGNLHLLELISGERRQMTTDAAAPSPSNSGNAIQYCCAQWSSDGQFLAYKRDVGVPMGDGYQYTYELWVHNFTNNTPVRLYENLPLAGLSWKPLSHLLTYAIAPEAEYFARRGGVDSSLAKGIWATDMDTTQNSELVTPQNGFSLANPLWSRDGRLVAFEEIAYYEGRGNFAYYDFEAAEYIPWDEPIGFVDWSPDSQTLAYDTLTYTPRGDERIFLRPRLGADAQQLSPDYELGYAFWPRFSPTGEQMAYLAEIGAFESMQYTLFVQPIAGGEARSLGVFSSAQNLSWLPDGSGLILATGAYEARQVIHVSLADGTVNTLAEGDSPALLPLAP